MTSINKSTFRNPAFAGLTALVCCALWGSAFPVIKIGYSLLNIEAGDYSSQILFAGVRFTIAGLLTVLIGSIISRRLLIIKGRGIAKVTVLSLFQTVLQYLFFYIGLAKTTGTKGSILNSCSVFFSVIIATLIMKQEKLTLKKLVGCILGFAGVVLVNLSDGDIGSSFIFMGEGFMILSALSYSISSVMIKLFSQTENPVALSGWQFTLGGIIMVIFGLLTGGRISFTDIKAVFLLLYLALLSAIAYTMWGVLLKYNDVSKVTVYSFMIPVFGCLFSVLFIGESLGNNLLRTIISLVLVCIGITFVNLKEKKNEGKNDSCKRI